MSASAPAPAGSRTLAMAWLAAVPGVAAAAHGGAEFPVVVGSERTANVDPKACAIRLPEAPGLDASSPGRMI